MKYLLIFSFLLISSVAISQDINGLWKGTITQNDGGYRPEYVMEMWLYVKGDSILGNSFVFVDSIYAEMIIKGTIQSGVYFQIQDDKMVSHEELSGMEWCIKSYQLLLKQIGGELKLEGHWQGITTFSSCIPGRVYLKKAIPRA